MPKYTAPSMAEWIAKLSKGKYGLGQAGVVAILLLPALKALYESISKDPNISAGTSAFCAATVGLVLLYVALVDRDSFKPSTPQLTAPVVSIAIAYMLGAVLYFLKFAAPAVIKDGYDPVTDFLSSASYVVGWVFLTQHDPDSESRKADRLCILVISILIAIAFVTKFGIDSAWIKLLPANSNLGRLFLNLFNRAIFFGVYAALRRTFYPPDHMSQLFILLFGCAQIAAGGRACLEDKICISPGVDWVIATFISWSLLLGKLVFGAYLLYVYRHGRPGYTRTSD